MSTEPPPMPTDEELVSLAVDVRLMTAEEAEAILTTPKDDPRHIAAWEAMRARGGDAV